jgi:predicted DNA-binding transcriptional regulator AlpA
MEDLYRRVLVELADLRQILKAGKKRLVTIDEAAHVLGVSPKTLRNKLSLGAFPLKTVKLGGRRLFKLVEIESLIDSL